MDEDPSEHDEAYNQLMDALRETCEEYEDELYMWEIEDALTGVRQEYQ